MKNNETLNLVLNRRSNRNFSTREIENEKIEILRQAFNSAPTSAARFQYSVVLVKDKNKIQKIMELSNQKNYPTMPSIFAVVCADYYRFNKVLEFNNQHSQIEGNNEKILTATVDATLAGYNMIMAAEAMGISTVIIGGIKPVISEIVKELEIPKHVFPLFGIVLGYPQNEQEMRHTNIRVPARLPLNTVTFIDKYNKDAFNKTVVEMMDEKTKQATGGKFTWTSSMLRWNQPEFIPNTLKQQKEQNF